MTFEIRHKPTQLSDLVFSDPAVQAAILGKGTVASACNILLHGPAGSGKSAACRVLAQTLVGPDSHGDIQRINVSRVTTRAGLCDMIEKRSKFVTLNPLGRFVFILEELDGAEHGAQMALKAVMDEAAVGALFLATTNDVNGITTPIRNRFLELPLAIPTSQDWAVRASSILATEGVQLTVPMTKHLLDMKAPGGSARDILRVLSDYVDLVRRANSAPKAAAPVTSVQSTGTSK